jgi:hypothetical protein
MHAVVFYVAWRGGMTDDGMNKQTARDSSLFLRFSGFGATGCAKLQG